MSISKKLWNQARIELATPESAVRCVTDCANGPGARFCIENIFLLQGIQITATTPTASAVRLETEAIDLEVSNRVQMASREANPNIG